MDNEDVFGRKIKVEFNNKSQNEAEHEQKNDIKEAVSNGSEKKSSPTKTSNLSLLRTNLDLL